MKKVIFMIAFILGSSYLYNGYAQSVGEISYQASFPTGKFSDFVGKTSWVGFTGQGRAYMKDDQLSIGGSLSWFYFPDKKGKQTVALEGDGGVYTGNQTNYTNIYGLMGIVQYDFKKRKEHTVPFVRGGVGIGYQNQHADVGLYTYQYDGVQFMGNLEAGVRFNYTNKGLVLAATYHNLPAAGDVVATSFFGVKIGISGFSY